MTKTMPSDFIQTLWELWSLEIITKEQVTKGLNVYGYELDVINPSGLVAVNETTTHTYKPYNVNETV